MKNATLLLVLFLGVLLVGCTTTIPVTSIDHLNLRVEEVKNELKLQGYQPTGAYHEYGNQALYTKYPRGEGKISTTENNDYANTDRYIFANADGDKVEYSVMYRVRDYSPGTVYYLLSVDLVGCTVSNPETHEQLCGENSVINQKIGHMPQDITVKVWDPIPNIIIMSVLLVGGVVTGAVLTL